MIGNLFQVATEFRFEIGHALISSDAVIGKVDQISQAAQNAQIGFQNMAASAAINLGLGGGGLLGILSEAIKVSDKFKSSQAQISTIFAANKDKLIGPVDDFNARLEVSEGILKRVAKVAREFSLDESALAATTKQLGAFLTNEGLAGPNMSKALDLSRMFLKSSPILGIDPGEAQGQLIRAISGQASMGDTFFRRLAAETSAMHEFQGGGKGGRGGGASSKFNMLSPEKRLETLTKALAQFSSQNQELEMQTNTVYRSLEVLKNTFMGLDGIIRPIGDAIVPALVVVIKELTQVLNTDIRDSFKNIGEILKPLNKDLTGFAVTLMQLKRITQDWKLAEKTFGILGILSIIAHFVGFVRIFKFIMYLFEIMTPIVLFLSKGIHIIVFLFRALWFVLSEVLAPFIAVVLIFQTFSRAMAYAKLADIKAMPKMLAQTTEWMARLQKGIGRIFSPITDAMDFMAKHMAWFFELSSYFNIAKGPIEAFVSLIEFMGTVMVMARATLQGIFFAIFQFIDNLVNLRLPWKGVGDAYVGGVEKYLRDNLDKLSNKDIAAVIQNNTNIAKVEIRNQFKENLEPDRIAFSIVQQLQKAARNPTEASSNRGGFSRSVGRGTT